MRDNKRMDTLLHEHSTAEAERVDSSSVLVITDNLNFKSWALGTKLFLIICNIVHHLITVIIIMCTTVIMIILNFKLKFILNNYL